MHNVTSGFDYLMDRGQKRTPARFTGNSFSDLCKAILAHRVNISITAEMTAEERRKEKQKLYWFSAPTQQTGQRRVVQNMAPCAFGMLDIDESTHGAARTLMKISERYSLLVYQTASHTSSAPRLRLVCEFSRRVRPDERRAICEATESMLMQEAGFTLASLNGQKARWENSDDYLVLDRSVYGAQSYLYCPHQGALANQYKGEAIDVDTLPRPTKVPDVKTTSTAKHRKTAQKAAGDDSDPFPLAPDEYTMSDLRSALSSSEWQNPSDDYETWVGNGIRLASLKGTEYEDEAKALWLEYSARSPANNIIVT